VRVCKVFYLTMLNVSQRRIEYTLSVRKDADTGIVRDDRRGQQMPVTDPFQKFERTKSDGTSGLCQLLSPITEEHPVINSI